MDRLIYTSMTGANAAMQQQAVLANNLANVSTTGFRAEMSMLRSVPLQGDGASTRVFGLTATAGYNDAAGPIQETGRTLDAAALGQAWFAVQSLDGSEAYTRNGAFAVSPDGQLVTNNGLPVLSDGGAPISIPANATLTLGSDGTITTKIGSQPTTALARIKLVTPTTDAPIARGNDGLFRASTSDSLPEDPNARLQAAALEGSNVNAIETMVAMIAVARQYDSQTQLMQTAQSNDKSATQLLSVSG